MKENIVNIENENTGKEEMRRGQSEQELYRITVSKGAEGALSKIVERVNSGFEGGRVNRTQMANWIILRFREVLSTAQIRDIRLQHINEFDYLESVLRKAKRDGRIPAELKAFITRELTSEESPPKKKRSLQDTVTNGDLTEGE